MTRLNTIRIHGVPESEQRERERERERGRIQINWEKIDAKLISSDHIASVDVMLTSLVPSSSILSVTTPIYLFFKMVRNLNHYSDVN